MRREGKIGGEGENIKGEDCGRREKREKREECGQRKRATAVGGGEATGWLSEPDLESWGLSVHALPWRKRPFPGGGLGIVVNIIDTAVGQLSLFPSEK